MASGIRLLCHLRTGLLTKKSRSRGTSGHLKVHHRRILETGSILVISDANRLSRLGPHDLRKAKNCPIRQSSSRSLELPLLGTLHGSVALLHLLYHIALPATYLRRYRELVTAIQVFDLTYVYDAIVRAQHGAI